MASPPIVKRFVRGECTCCGRKRQADEEVWCRRCADIARSRGLLTPRRQLTPDEAAAYWGAVLLWLSESLDADTESD